MRGVMVSLLVLSTLLLASCSIDDSTSGYANVNEFNRVSIIDFPYEEIDSREVTSIHALYNNENKALALYRKTLDLFGNKQPFTSVMLKQEVQIKYFEEVYTKYELKLPEENFYSDVTTFSEIEEACAASILFAEQSMNLYDEWLDHKGLDYPVNNQDLRFLYQKIRDDYERSIIPTFKRCGRGIW